MLCSEAHELRGGVSSKPWDKNGAFLSESQDCEDSTVFSNGLMIHFDEGGKRGLANESGEHPAGTLACVLKRPSEGV